MTGMILGICFVGITEKLTIKTKMKISLYERHDLPLLFDQYNGKMQLFPKSKNSVIRQQ